MKNQFNSHAENIKEFSMYCYRTRSICEMRSAKYSEEEAKKWNLTRAGWVFAVWSALIDKSRKNPN